jgi:hypothetical protein
MSVSAELHALAHLVSQYVNVNVLGKKADSYDVLTFANLVSSFDSAQYFCERMSRAKNLASADQLLSEAVLSVTIDGLWLEFGVATGKTLNMIAACTRQKVYGFDGFSGLPEDWRTGFEAGMFAQGLPMVADNAKLVVGLFDDTLPAFVEEHAGPVAFLHVDCDLYSSTRTIFTNLTGRIVPGTVILFDEYFNYPGWRQHEFKAFQEFVGESGLAYDYVSFVSSHQQVCVVIK